MVLVAVAFLLFSCHLYLSSYQVVHICWVADMIGYRVVEEGGGGWGVYFGIL